MDENPELESKPVDEETSTPKIKYETPVVVPLGELASGSGQVNSCHSGTLASNCQTGNTAAQNCNNGNAAGVSCKGGSTPIH